MNKDLDVGCGATADTKKDRSRLSRFGQEVGRARANKNGSGRYSSLPFLSSLVDCVMLRSLGGLGWLPAAATKSWAAAEVAAGS